jgi:hypothetical protein
MEKLILAVHPAEYLFNGPSNCGVYVVKGILSAFHRDKYADPREYHPSNFFAKKFGWTLVEGLHETLYRFNIWSKKGFAHGDTEQKVELLKSFLRAGYPVILNIGSCYETKDRWIAKIVPHWISIWGYDETDFFLYDSSVPLDKQNLRLPIGNRKVEHQDLIWYWGAAHWFKLKGLFGRRYLYVTVKSR